MTRAISTCGRRTSSSPKPRRERPPPDLASGRSRRARIRPRREADENGGETRRPSIPVAAIIIAFALLWAISLRVAASSGGAVNVVAKALFLILTSLGSAAVGFFLPMAPVLSAVIGSAFFAGALATAGALVGMGLSDAILTRLETRASGAKAGAAPAADGRKPPRG
jgi:hypothetical protein